MATSDEIDAYRKRLDTYRSSLRHTLQHAAHYGGETFASVELANTTRELRASIRQLKGALRSAGVSVADSFDDELPASEASGTPSAPLALSVVAPEENPADGPALSELPYASCFISYSHQNEVFAQHLARSLRGAGLKVWIASDDMQGGGKLYEQVKAAIRRQDKLLVVLSGASIVSNWVTTEIQLAWREERTTNARKLFPIRLVDMPTLRQWEAFDPDVGKDLAVEVREYFIPDFSQWQNVAAFEWAFGQLLRDLRTEG